MTNILACEHSELVTAVATVAPGEIPDPCTPSHPISMLEVCTSEDNIVKLVRKNLGGVGVRAWCLHI